MGISELKRAGDSDTNAPPYRTKGADFSVTVGEVAKGDTGKLTGCNLLSFYKSSWNWFTLHENIFRSVILSSGPNSPIKSGESGLCFPLFVPTAFSL